MPKYCMFLWDFHSKNRYLHRPGRIGETSGKSSDYFKKLTIFTSFQAKKKFWRLDKNWLNYTQISILLESSCKICKIRTSLTSLINVWKVSSKFDKFWPIFSPLWLILTSFDKFNQNLSSSIKIWNLLKEFDHSLTSFIKIWRVSTNFDKV